MPPKQRPAAAGGGGQPQKSTGKQELGQQEREAGPSPPAMRSEVETSELRSEFERVMEALKCSCPTVIRLVGTFVSSGAKRTAGGTILSLDDVGRLAKELSKHSGLQTIFLSGTCVVLVVFESGRGGGGLRVGCRGRACV